MSNQLSVYPNTVTTLMSHRVVDKTISVELGHLNVIIGEHLHTLTSGMNVTIPKNTLFAYANLSPSQTIITERIEHPTFAKDLVVHAEVNGIVYDANPSPATQSSLSLYRSLVDMLIKTPARKLA